MDKRCKEKKGLSFEGSYTVEAALVMSLTLFFIAGLLTGIFRVHSRIVGNMVLQEGLEQCIYAEEEIPEEFETQKEQSLHSFFWCQNAELRIRREGKRASGWVNAGVETEIVIKEFDPENFLRLLTAAGI